MKFKRSEFNSAAFEYLQERLAYQQRRGDRLQQLLLTDLKEAKGDSFMGQLKDALFDKYALEIQVQAVVDSKLKIIEAEKDLITRNFHRMVLLVQEYDQKIEQLTNRNRPIETPISQPVQELPVADLVTTETGIVDAEKADAEIADGEMADEEMAEPINQPLAEPQGPVANVAVPIEEEIPEKPEIVDVQPEDFLLDYSPNQSESNKPTPLAIEKVDRPPMETALVPFENDASSDSSDDSISLPEDLQNAIEMPLPESTQQIATSMPTGDDRPTSVLEILDSSPETNDVKQETPNEIVDQGSMDDQDESTNINDTFDEIIEKSENSPSYTICKSMTEIQDELLMAIDDQSLSPDSVLIQDPVVPSQDLPVPAIMDAANSELTCDDCGKLCKSKHGLKMHKFKAHSKSSHKTPSANKRRKRSSEGSTPSGEILKCDDCDYVTHKKSLLVQHSRNHGKNLIPCKNCDSKFQYYFQLNKHKINCEQ